VVLESYHGNRARAPDEDELQHYRPRADDGICKIWHPETNTFHVLIGEVVITLDDVQCLLHLSITGPFLNHSRMRKDEAMDLLKRNLGAKEEIIQRNFIFPVSTAPELDSHLILYQTHGCVCHSQH
jgi:hypothetical protein